MLSPVSAWMGDHRSLTSSTGVALPVMCSGVRQTSHTIPLCPSIGLFKMFSHWIWGIFNIQIQSDRGHKLMLYMFQNKDKDLLGIYQYVCDPFCVSLLTDRHLKVRSNSILFTFSDKGALTSARDS